MEDSKQDVVGVSFQCLGITFAEIVPDFDCSVVVAARDKVWLVCTGIEVDIVYTALLVCLQSEIGC